MIINKLLTWLLLLIGVATYAQTNLTEDVLKEMEQDCDNNVPEACERLYFYWARKKFVTDKEKEEVKSQYTKYLNALANLNRPRYLFVAGLTLINTIEEGQTNDMYYYYTEGITKISKAAELDYPPAQVMMADFYANINTRIDINFALYFLYRACESDYTDACDILDKVGNKFDDPITKQTQAKLWKAFEESPNPFLLKESYKKIREAIKDKDFEEE